MELTNISIGQIIKNYKEFCSLVNEPEKTSNSKVAQLKDWQTYLKYRRDGHKFIIEEIYDEQQETIDLRSNGNHSVYGNDIKALIMNLLVNNAKRSNERVLSFSTHHLLRALEMINSNYSYCKRNIPDISKFLQMNESCVYDFFETTHSNLKNSLETALNQLRNQSLIMWEKCTMVCVDDVIPEMNSIQGIKLYEDAKGVKAPHFHINRRHRSATDAEKEIILQCEDIVVKEMNRPNKGVVIANRQWGAFISQVNTLLKDKANINFYYTAYKLIINRDKIIEEREQIIKDWELNDIMVDDCKDSLNSLVKNGCSANAQKRHDKAVIESNNIAQNKLSQKQIIRSNDTYVDNQNLLIEVLLDRKQNNILKELKKDV